MRLQDIPVRRWRLCRPLPFLLARRGERCAVIPHERAVTQCCARNRRPGAWPIVRRRLHSSACQGPRRLRPGDTLFRRARRLRAGARAAPTLPFAILRPTNAVMGNGPPCTWRKRWSEVGVRQTGHSRRLRPCCSSTARDAVVRAAARAHGAMMVAAPAVDCLTAADGAGYDAHGTAEGEAFGR